MHQTYLDAMTIVQVYGKPVLFVTMTCNSNWVEITNNLRFNEEASNRVDLTARVSNMKLNTVLDNMEGSCHRVSEIRATPRTHTNTPGRTTDNYDNIVCAEIPDPTR